MAIAIGAAVSVASTVISKSMSSGGGGEGGSSDSSGVQQSQNPLAGSRPPETPKMTASKAVVLPAASADKVPTQDVGTEFAKKDFNDIWADRLSRFLDKGAGE